MASAPQCLPCVEQPGRLVAHHVGRADLHVGVGQRELHALVGADLAAEHLPLVRVVDGAVDEPVAVADGLGRQQDALGVPAVDDVAESGVDLADHVVGRNPHAVVVHLVGGVVEHRAHRHDLERVGLLGADLAQVDQEQGQPAGAVLGLVAGAGQHEGQVGLRRCGWSSSCAR